MNQKNLKVTEPDISPSQEKVDRTLKDGSPIKMKRKNHI
jgi:hypothetical protein